MKPKIKPPLFSKESSPLKSTDALNQRRKPTHEEISETARALWEHRGRPVGEDTDIWLEAEQKLQGGIHVSAADEAHFADRDQPLNNDGEPSGEIEERLRSFGAPGDRSATSL
jgi:hypothetical protein